MKINITILFLLITAFCNAQVSSPGVPPSTTDLIPVYSARTVYAEMPDMAEINTQDAVFQTPYRYAVNLPVSLDISKDGQWNETGNGMVWRGKITAPGAEAVTLYFDRFYLPSGSELFVYDPEKTKVLGAYTEKNNNPEGVFAVELVPGENVILEYFQPFESRGTPQIHVYEAGYAYRGVQLFTRKRGFGGSGPCEVNISCPEGDVWRREGNGVVLISVKKGNASYWCSGSLVNNTRMDYKPYILTADHCGEGSTPEDRLKWIFYFHYESPGCADPLTPPIPRSMTGSVLRAHGGNSGDTGSDFFLVELSSGIPVDYNVYYNGWSRENIPGSSGVTIHQPAGDIQKISTYTTPVITTTYGSNNNPCFWKVVWAQTEHGHGVTEGGSSGSPLFDQNHRIIGTLTGGLSSCDSIHLDDPDYYGKFSWHWSQNGNDPSSRLSDWLDPINSGVQAMNGVPLGINDREADSRLSTYPNPCNTYFILDHTGLRGKVSLGFEDISGRIIFSRIYDFSREDKTKIDVTGIPSGMYFLITETEKNTYFSKITVK